jgi:ribosomal protein S18 acetylase RimI-like enzyme
MKMRAVELQRFGANTLTWVHSCQGVDWEALAALYRVAPLGDKTPADLEAVFGSSRHTCFVYDGERLVAAGRVLADGRDCAYVCDVAVLPSHQGLGIGRDVMAKLIELSKGHKKIILYAVPGKEEFYKKLGFKRMTTAMAIFQDEAGAFARGLVSNG